MPILLVWMACAGGDSPTPGDSAPVAREVPWDRGLPELGAAPRGRLERRAIVHLHSPWSHDACDGHGLVDGVVDEDCLADLREGLCTTRIDYAFLTDHPAHAGEQSFADLPHPRPGDLPLEQAGVVVGNEIPCENGHAVRWLPGIEDELMPVSLDRQVSTDPAENDRIYNQADAEAVTAERGAGAAVLTAHTESRELSWLEARMDEGMVGLELFNLHASLAPDIRSEFLGLDPLGWVEGIQPFAGDDGTGEPDLMFLALLEEQANTVAKWDAMLARGPMTGVAGTDAHQNTLPLDLRDGERGDSYRRMLRWFSNHLWLDEEGPAAAQAAIEAGRVVVVFEALGTPVDFDFRLETDAGVVEMGGEGGAGTLVVDCPTLHPESPRGLEAPELTATVYKDGVAWQTGCGAHDTDGPGVYRVRVDAVPHHLRPFLGDDPEPWLRPFPWLYTNAIRVR